MNYKANLLFYGMLVLLLFNSCASSRQGKMLRAHRQLLSHALSADASPEEKMDALGTSVVQMMHEALKFVNIKKGVKYVGAYQNDNEADIEKLVKDIQSWQNGLSTFQRVTLGIQILQKPYTKDLIDLIPKFQRKYQQIKFVSSLSKKLKDSLLDVIE